MSETKSEVKTVGIFARIAKIENFAILAKFAIFAKPEIFTRNCF